MILAGFVEISSHLHPAFSVGVHFFLDTIDVIRKIPILIFFNIFIYLEHEVSLPNPLFYPGEEVSHSIEACYKYSSIINAPWSCKGRH
jgi:hypothetical protein